MSDIDPKKYADNRRKQAAKAVVHNRFKAALKRPADGRVGLWCYNLLPFLLKDIKKLIPTLERHFDDKVVSVKVLQDSNQNDSGLFIQFESCTANSLKRKVADCTSKVFPASSLFKDLVPFPVCRWGVCKENEIGEMITEDKSAVLLSVYAFVWNLLEAPAKLELDITLDESELPEQYDDGWTDREVEGEEARYYTESNYYGDNKFKPSMDDYDACKVVQIFEQVCESEDSFEEKFRLIMIMVKCLNDTEGRVDPDIVMASEKFVHEILFGKFAKYVIVQTYQEQEITDEIVAAIAKVFPKQTQKNRWIDPDFNVKRLTELATGWNDFGQEPQKKKSKKQKHSEDDWISKIRCDLMIEKGSYEGAKQLGSEIKSQEHLLKIQLAQGNYDDVLAKIIKDGSLEDNQMVLIQVCLNGLNWEITHFTLLLDTCDLLLSENDLIQVLPCLSKFLNYPATKQLEQSKLFLGCLGDKFKATYPYFFRELKNVAGQHQKLEDVVTELAIYCVINIAKEMNTPDEMEKIVDKYFVDCPTSAKIRLLYTHQNAISTCKLSRFFLHKPLVTRPTIIESLGNKVRSLLKSEGKKLGEKTVKEVSIFFPEKENEMKDAFRRGPAKPKKN